MLSRFPGGGELLPSALRWLRRRAGATDDADTLPVPATELEAGASSITLESEGVGGSAEGLDHPGPMPEPPPTADDVPDLRELVEANRNDPKPRWQLGLALVAARKLNLALAHLEVAATQDPSLDRGELADVREAQKAERLVRRYPRDPELRLALGRLYLALDQGDAALAELEEAARLRPELAPAHTLLGFEYAYRGRIGRAREHWGRARDLDPEDAMSRTGLEAINDGRDPLRAIWQQAAT